ncbi:hypothetical protein Poly51_49180 [Rubripirellula tenax]|uniref:Uncharacterized protein n=1 Tax=Rubripirellula tenax TaxID=2528015 RepID=A0A5C6EKP0_9BACT|nr:hypothetical protein Poly51_49180 [Rubripirellula tenax]
MKTPTRDDCRTENCLNADEQFSRILHRWRDCPYGSFDDTTSNHEALRRATEFLIGRVLKRSSNPSHHEYWCDGTDFVQTNRDDHRYYFGGACIFSDRHANAMWLGPFELSLAYSPTDFGMPTSVTLRLGHVCREHTISRRFPTGRTYRLYAIAHSLFGDRPSDDAGWAANVTLCPYNEAEQ